MSTNPLLKKGPSDFPLLDRLRAMGNTDATNAACLIEELYTSLAGHRKSISETQRELERKSVLLDETADKLEHYRKGHEAVPHLQQQLLLHSPGRRTESEYERMGRPSGWTWLADVKMWERDSVLLCDYAGALKRFIEALPCPTPGCIDGSIRNTGPDPQDDACEWCYGRHLLLEDWASSSENPANYPPPQTGGE